MKKILLMIGGMTADVLLACLAFVFSVIICTASEDTVFITLGQNIKPIFAACIIFAFILPLLEYFLKIHIIVWRYSGLRDVLRFLIVISSAFLAFFIIHYGVLPRDLNSRLRVYDFAYMLTCIFCVGVRILLRAFGNRKKSENVSSDTRPSKKVMIIGAGSAAALLLKEMGTNSFFRNCEPCCIIDDSSELLGKQIYGVKVVGNRFSIPKIAEKYSIKMIVFAIPSCRSSDKAEILSICSKTGCEIKVMPGIDQIIDKGFSATSIRDVRIEDLLGRDPIKLDNDDLRTSIKGKTVMVTGGGGSIGSELCRQICAYAPSKLIIFDIYENSSYELLNELQSSYSNVEIEVLIGSVRDIARLDCIFEKYRPNIVYHAAAHKHVPLMETSPHESVKNNVYGTLNVVQISDKYNVERFVLISTDKAVNPTNVMGATKRICEQIIQCYDKYSSTRFVAVRFGNVLGSNGSVIPLFKKQIAAGGPVTVTHPDIIRYFMTIPEAVSLVLQAGSYAKGGEIFVLDMGKPVRIVDLAENLIRLSGYLPYKDIDIKFTGLRPGEKLYEELLMAEEGLNATEHDLIFKLPPVEIDEEKFFTTLHELKRFVYSDSTDISEYIKILVPTFNHKTETKHFEIKKEAETSEV